MDTEQKYLDSFKDDLNYIFYEAVDIHLTNLRQCGFWIKTMNHQHQAAEIRQKRLNKGLPAPPVMICSITGKCNLKCRGCYAMTRDHSKRIEISAPLFEKLAEEAADIGTNIILLAGGEPLLRKEILETAGRMKEIVFPVFTNGTLLDKDYLRFFTKHRNLIPVLSIEGNEQRTDERRGTGLFESIMSRAEMLRRNKMFFGFSFTLTRDNFDELTNPDNLLHYHKQGSRLFFFVEYVPLGTEDRKHCISEEQKARLPELIRNLKGKLPGIYVCLPGEEEQYGGCLAAGRGFIHVSPTGDVEPCPFAPYSDSNITHMPLTDALNSILLRHIRNNHHLLKESEGGCTLRENREWIEKQLGRPESLSA